MMNSDREKLSHDELETSPLIEHPSTGNASLYKEIMEKLSAKTPLWIRNISFGSLYLIWLPFAQGAMFSLGLYFGKVMLVRPLLSRLRLREY